MALQCYLYFALLFLFSQHHGSANQESSTPNEAADDKLCLGQKALATGRRLAERYHDDAVLSNEDFRHLLTDVEKSLHNYGAADFEKKCANNTETELKTGGMTVNCSDILSACPSVDEIYSRHSEEESGLHYQRLAVALQEAIFSSTNPKCHFAEDHHKESNKPSTGQAWGYGLGFVTLVVIISNIGALLTPFMSRTFFQRLLQFLVAMGAGTLVATGLLVLLPEAFGIVSVEELSEDYVWKSATAVFSIYVFFISERFLKFLLKSREMKNIRRNESIHIDPGNGNNPEKDPMASSAENGPPDHGHSHFVTASEGKGGPVATVAWMVLIGDVMHNFVDGMAIGAAFTENTFLGVSIGIAVLCEELPHELGDVAILLHSGMTMKRAVFLNFLSACVCYVGLVIGILLGENTEANRWILAVAGGLFLYVPLVDMLPDMSQHLDMKVREGTTSQSKRAIPREAWFILMCQSVGLFIGMCIILVVVNFTGMIELGH